jgi:hypothetical protein
VGEVKVLAERVATIIEEAQSRVVRSVNSAMVLACWHIGRELVEFVQGGAARAGYGEQVLEELSAQLQDRVGRGYSVTNLKYFRLFYLHYKDRRPEVEQEARETSPTELVTSLVTDPEATRLTTFSNRLSWSHYRTLTKVNDPEARAFYEIEAAREGWSVPHLERQIHTQLHLRLLKSRNKEGVRELARQRQTVERPSDVIKSPLILDFLGLSGRHEYREGRVKP